MRRLAGRTAFPPRPRRCAAVRYAGRRFAASVAAGLMALAVVAMGVAPARAAMATHASVVTYAPIPALREPPAADSSGRARSILSVTYELARPTGWVRVRENAIIGTRLSFGPDLGVHAASTLGLKLRLPLGTGTLGIAVSGTTLRGSAALPRSVFFNGSTLLAGTVLKTRTNGPDFMRVVLDYERRLTRVGAAGELSGRVGLDATLLDFRLQGTLSPSTVGHETKEDFVTQELPAPFLGAALRLPLGHRATLHIAADGGGLPWVSSLRYEGGLVRLRQRRLDASAGLDLALAPRLDAGATLHWTNFLQDEQSGEDGNEFRMASVGGVVQVGWTF